MVKPRTTVSSSTTVLAEDPDPFAAGLEAHRAETAASLKELQASMMASMRSQSDTMRSEIMEELRQLHLGSRSPLRPQAQPFPLPTSQASSSASRSELDPVISQVLDYQPLSTSIPETSAPLYWGPYVGAASTMDLSVLPLYSSYVTNGMLAPNVGITGINKSMVSSTQIPSSDPLSSDKMVFYSSEMDSRNLGHLFTVPWSGNPYMNQTPWGHNQPTRNLVQGYYQQGYYQPIAHTLPSNTQATQAALPIHSNSTMSSSTSPLLRQPLVTSHSQHNILSQQAQSSMPQSSGGIHSTTTTTYPQFHFTNQPPLGHYPSHYVPNFPMATHQHNQWDPHLPTMKQMRLDLPVFSGDDPVDWVNKAEQFFQLYQIPDDRKITIAAMHLIGNAANIW